MRILLVAATGGEVAPTVERFGGAAVRQNATDSAFTLKDHEVFVLVTGVGMVATAAWTSRALAERHYDLALNVGLCGSFDRGLELGSVVHTVSDRIVELGAENDEEFLSIEELNLVDPGAAIYSRPQLVNLSPPDNDVLLTLPQAWGITVNTVHGNDRSIATVVARCSPQVESMEGAAFMYACMIHDIYYAQVRAVSNFVEKRNRAAWRVPEAIGNLTNVTAGILEAV